MHFNRIGCRLHNLQRRDGTYVKREYLWIGFFHRDREAVFLLPPPLPIIMISPSSPLLDPYPIAKRSNPLPLPSIPLFYFSYILSLGSLNFPYSSTNIRRNTSLAPERPFAHSRAKITSEFYSYLIILRMDDFSSAFAAWCYTYIGTRILQKKR